MPDQTLAQRIRAKYPGEYDDLSDTDLETRVLAKYPEYADLPRTPAAAAPASAPSGWAERHRGNAWLGERIMDLGRAAIDPENAPVIGGMLGGLAAAPFTAGMSIPAGLAVSAGGAAAGGALGAGARRMDREASGVAGNATAGELASEMATEGAWQGAAELAGGAMTKAAAPVGRFLYGKALGASKALQQQFPDLVETGIREGLNVTPAGAERAASQRAASSAAADEMIRAASPTAAPVRPSEIVPRSFQPAQAALRAQRSIEHDVTGEMADLAARRRRVVESFGGKPGVPAIEDAIETTSLPRTAAAPAGAEFGDEAVRRLEAELGPQARLLPSHMLKPTAGEARAAQQLGAASGAVPRRVLSGSRELPAAQTTEFVSERVVPGREAVPPERGGISLADAQARKKAAQEQQEIAYRKRARGQDVNDIEDMTDIAMASAYRDAIEQRLPEIAAQNKNTQSLIGITRALEDAQLRPHILRWLMSAAGGGAAGGATTYASGDPARGAQAALTTFLATSPRALGRAGIILGRIGETNGQIPAKLAQALTDALRQDEQLRADQPRSSILPPLKPSADADQQAARPAPPIRLAVSHGRDEDEARAGRGVLPPLRPRQAGKAPSPAPLRPR